jgi:hypothetical protein
VRRNPYLGAVAVASLYSLLSIPGDALWHALYGIDLTAWSPPHLMIGAMMCAVLLAGVATLARARSLPLAAGQAANPADIAIPVVLGLTLNVAMIIGTIEWEVWGGGYPLLVRANPIWVYPLVGGGLAFAAVLLARRLSRFRWAATLVALTFFAVRGAVTLGLAVTGNVVPALPPVFALGALLLDLAPWARLRGGWPRDAAMAAVFTAGYAALALPLLVRRAHLPAFGPLDVLLAVAATLGVTLLLAPIVARVGRGLVSQIHPEAALSPG